MRYLKQSTTVTVLMGPALDKTDGVTEEVALSPTVYLSKAGAAQGARNSATAITHDALGYYLVELNGTDTNTLGHLRALFHDNTTHTPVWEDFCVVTEQVFNSLFAGTDLLDVNASQVGGTAQTAGDIVADLAVVDGIVDSILDDTGTSGVLLAATADSAALVDSIWDEVLTGATHNVASSAGKRLRGVEGPFAGAVSDVAATTTQFDTNLTEVDGFWNEQLVFFTSGALAGQCKPIKSYLNASGSITLSDALTSAPADADTFDILPAHIHPASEIADAVWDEAQADHVTAGTFGQLGIAQDAKLDLILTDTAELQGDWTDGGRLDLILDLLYVDTSTTLDDLCTSIDGKCDTLLTNIGTPIDTDIATDIANAQADITLIVADTDELQAEWADGGRLDVILDAASAPTAAAVADAVWDEALAGHLVAGSTGEALNGAASAGDPWVTALPGAYGAGSAGKLLSDMGTQVTAVLVDTGTTLDTKLNTMQTDVTAILADTNELQSDDTPAALAALDALIDIIDANVDLILADTAELQGDWVNGGRLDLILDSVAAPATAAAIADAVWDEAPADHVAAGTFGSSLAAALAGLTSSVAGLGAVANTITVTVGGDPLAGVDVWVTSDAAGTTVVAGTLQTDGNGQVVFYLDAGTYYVWQQKTGYNFECPDTLTVT